MYDSPALSRRCHFGQGVPEAAIRMFSRLREVARTAIDDYRYQGPEVFFWHLFVKACSPIVKLDLQILFELDLSQPIEPRRARVDCSIQPATESEIDEILDMQMPLPQREQLRDLSDDEELRHAQSVMAREKARRAFQAAMRAGEQCYLARVGGEPVHSNWIRFADCRPVEGRPVDLGPDEVYTTDAFTAVPWRGKGLHEVVLAHMLIVAQRRGCRHAFTITDLFKAGSRRGVKRVGWSQRGRLLYVTPRRLGRTWMLRIGGDVEPMFRHARAMSGTAEARS
jgi:hypothetical protein